MLNVKLTVQMCVKLTKQTVKEATIQILPLFNSMARLRSKVKVMKTLMVEVKVVTLRKGCYVNVSASLFRNLARIQIRF